LFSEEFDTEIRYSVDDRVRNAKLYSQIRDQVREYIGTMAAALEAALATEAESRWVGGEKRGRKLDRRRLAEWVMGSENDSIWKRLEEGENIDTAVTLLWDCSGSMGSSEIASNKAALARIAAIAFHEALTRAGIPHEVLGFNSGGKSPEGLAKAVKAAEARGEDMKRYSRLGDTDKRMVFTDFGQADGRAICNITGGAANRDGECVMWAARRLAQRPERRKILIVGSDGQPSGALYGETEKRFLKETVQRVMDAGIEVVGIGIMDKAVREYYPVNVVIKTVGDLPKVVMGQLTNLLLKKGTGHGQGRQALL
jgi:cobaltochelatase CobT